MNLVRLMLAFVRKDLLEEMSYRTAFVFQIDRKSTRLNSSH